MVTPLKSIIKQVYEVRGGVMLTGHYETGVERNATQNEIKKAYHRLVMEYHPDESFTPEEQKIYLGLSQKKKNGGQLSESEKNQLVQLKKNTRVRGNCKLKCDIKVEITFYMCYNNYSKNGR